MGPQGIRSRPEVMRSERTRAGKSITTLAADLGVSRSHLSNIERGARKASPDVAHAISTAIGRPLAELFEA